MDDTPIEHTRIISTLHGKKEMYTLEDLLDFGRFAVRKDASDSDQSIRAIHSYWVEQNSLRVIWKGRELRPGDNFEVDENKVVTVRFQLP